MNIQIKTNKIMVIELNDANFDEIVLQSEELVLVDFAAIWCGPCKVMGPIIDEISEEYKNVVVGKMDVDGNVLIPAKYGIRNIPTILLFKNGELVDRQVGASTKTAITSKINALL